MPALKYALIIPDGAADAPIPELDDQTPLEAAHTPHLDRLAARGRIGTVATTPPGVACGSDTCSMSLLGYDPRKYHTGRAPLEAASMGVDLSPTDTVFRINMVTLLDHRMLDHSAGHIASAESARLLADLAGAVGAGRLLPDVTFHPGVSYRNLMIDRSGDAWKGLRTVPPHDIPGQPITDHLPTGTARASLLRDLIDLSGELFQAHEVNITRREMAERPATHAWPWGQGRTPAMPAFIHRFGVRGAMITAVDLLAGIASLIGWDRLDVPGQTSYHDTDYAAAGHAAVAAMPDYDLVCIHIESPDEAGHAADAATKQAAIEAIDEHVIAPVVEALEEGDQPYRVLVLPDHHTRVATRKHDPTPVPFLMAGTGVRGILKGRFTERDAAQADLHIREGHDLMEFFLKSGRTT